jgi:hypothetical protein
VALVRCARRWTARPPRPARGSREEEVLPTLSTYSSSLYSVWAGWVFKTHISNTPSKYHHQLSKYYYQEVGV